MVKRESSSPPSKGAQNKSDPSAEQIEAPAAEGVDASAGKEETAAKKPPKKDRTRLPLSRGVSLERKKLEAILGEIKALQTGRSQELEKDLKKVRTALRPRSKWLTAVDVLVMVLVAQALVFGTPLGSLLQRGWAWMFSDPSDVRPLLSYFSQPSESRLKLASLQAALKKVKRQRKKPDPNRDTLATAVAFLLSEGRGNKYFDVRLPATAQRALRSVAVVWPGDAALPKQREAALLSGLARLRQSFGADEAAVAALVVSPDSLAFALQRARVSGDATPGRFESFRKFLTLDDRMAAGRLVHSAFALSAAYSMARPIDGKPRVTSRFGPRMHPVLGVERLHSGIDYGVPIGTPVKAAQGGKVTFAGADGANGRFIRLDHGHGLTSTYCHLDSHAVKKGPDHQAGPGHRQVGQHGAIDGAAPALSDRAQRFAGGPRAIPIELCVELPRLQGLNRNLRPGIGLVSARNSSGPAACKVSEYFFVRL